MKTKNKDEYLKNTVNIAKELKDYLIFSESEQIDYILDSQEHDSDTKIFLIKALKSDTANFIGKLEYLMLNCPIEENESKNKSKKMGE